MTKQVLQTMKIPQENGKIKDQSEIDSVSSFGPGKAKKGLINHFLLEGPVFKTKRYVFSFHAS